MKTRIASVLAVLLGFALVVALPLLAMGCSGSSFGQPLPPPPPPGPGGDGTEPPSPPVTPPVYGRVLGHVVIENAYDAGAATLASSEPGVVVQGASRSRPLAEPGGPEYSASDFLASFRPGASDREIRAAIERHGYEVKRVIEGAGIYIITVPRGTDPARASEAFLKDPLVEHAQPNYVARVSQAPAGRGARVPNDPYYSRQWALEAMSLPYAWNETTGSSAVTVAVIDTGVQTNHPDLAAQLTPGRDFYYDSDYVADYHGHGTHVAGIIGAVTNNGIGIAGVNWNVRVMPLKAADNSTSGYLDLSSIIEALRYAADRGAEVVSMSFQIGGATTGEDLFMDQAIEYAYNRGVTMVAAAGNDGEPWVAYPARHPKVIAVGAVGADLVRTGWSNYGSAVDVVAPGAGILSTWPGSTYANASGTSMATPHVSGLVALIIASGVRGPEAVRNMLHETAMDLGAQGFDTEYGWGLVNAHAAATGSTITSMKAFAGEDDGTSLTPHSDMASPAPGGVYEIKNVEAGAWYVYGWIDVNANERVDDGDYFGRTAGRITSNGNTVTGVNLRVRLNVGSIASKGSQAGSSAVVLSVKGR